MYYLAQFKRRYEKEITDSNTLNQIAEARALSSPPRDKRTKQYKNSKRRLRELSGGTTEGTNLRKNGDILDKFKVSERRSPNYLKSKKKSGYGDYIRGVEARSNVQNSNKQVPFKRKQVITKSANAPEVRVSNTMTPKTVTVAPKKQEVFKAVEKKLSSHSTPKVNTSSAVPVSASLGPRGKKSMLGRNLRRGALGIGLLGALGAGAYGVNKLRNRNNRKRKGD